MRLVRSAILFATFLGCSPVFRDNSASQVDMASQAATALMAAELGQGHSSLNFRTTGTHCAIGTVRTENNTEARVRFDVDESWEQVMEDLSGALSFGVSFPLLSAAAGSEYARSVASNQFRETWSLTISRKMRSMLEPGSISLVAGATDVSSEEWSARCGDGFVQQIDYGAVFKGTLLIEYSSREEKQRLAGGLNVRLIGGIAEMSGSLEKAERLKESKAKVQLVTKQIGGQPKNLVQTLDMKFASCDPEDAAACFETFAGFASYAQDFSSQLVHAENFEPLTYHTSTYAEAHLPHPPVLDGDTSSEVAEFRLTLSSELNNVSLLADRLRLAREQDDDTSLTAQRTALIGTLELARVRLREALELCFGRDASSPDALERPCRDRAQRALEQVPEVPSQFLSF